MRIKEVYMTQTIQPYSCTLCKTSKNLIKNAPVTEDNKSLFLAVFDSLNKLNERLNRLNYLLERKKIERILYQNKQGAEK